MLVNKQFWSIKQPIDVLEFRTPLVIGIDQSKSGYAMTIGDEYGTDLHYVEFSGTGMSDEDFLTELSLYMLTMLSKVSIAEVGYEKMILKKGMGYYKSSTVLHNVRVETLKIFRTLGHEPTEVNNMAWKGAILPDGYRGRSEKGSLRYCKDLDPVKFQGATDNRTDSYCIYKYLIKLRGFPEVRCNTSEKAPANMLIVILPDGYEDVPSLSLEFKYNYEFSLKENAAFFANRSSTPGKAYINPDLLPLSEIYTHARFFTSTEQDPVLLVIPRGKH